MTTKDIEGWVLDYACKFHHHEVIAALHQRYGVQTLSVLNVCDARLSAATIHRIVFCRDFTELDTAVDLVEKLNAAISDVIPLRVYFRLVYSLKMRVLLDQLKTRSMSACALNLKLNEYFPRCGIVDIKTAEVSQKDLQQLQTRASNFRKVFLSLLINKKQRKAYMQDEFEAAFGRKFMQSLEKHVTRFLEKVNENLPLTVLEKMVEKGTDAILKNVPSISAPFDILLECLTNKTRLDSCDLLDLLTFIHPMSTQDRLSPELQLTFGSDDSNPPSEDPGLSHVYVVSSNSDTTSTTQGSQGSQVKGQVIKGQQKSTLSPEDDSTTEDTRKHHFETSDVDGNLSGSVCVIPSSNKEEIEMTRGHTALSTSRITYPRLRDHEKNMCVKLCVVKLYREQSLEDKLDHCPMQLYS